MADFKITSQTYETVKDVTGVYAPMVRVGFETTDSPMVKGHVDVPRSLMADPVNFAQAAAGLIGEAIASHKAVNALGQQ